jgi:8-oxo-dGTP pyrophosphatase MutT (NUDIX family)
MEPELRHAARALVLDPLDRTLLVRFEIQGRAWWATPGGGLEEGETHEEAVRRELVEEAGISGAPLGPCVWIREHTFPWMGRVLRQRERIYLVRIQAAPAAPSFSGEQLQREGLAGQRWWALDEMLRSEVTFAPRRLPALVRDLLERGPPPEPIDVGV